MRIVGSSQVMYLQSTVNGPQVMFFDVYYVDAPIVGVQITGDPNAD